MKITINIELDNDAFQGAGRDREVAMALGNALHLIHKGLQSGPDSTHKIIDTNGNTCGSVEVTDKTV